MGDMTPNFSRGEFACPCCGDDRISPRLVDALQRIRDAVGEPLTVTSGVRCPAHNTAVGGAPSSWHVPRDMGLGEVGHAADLAVDNSKLRYKVLLGVAMVRPVIHRVGIAEQFIHVDVGDAPAQVAWTY